jgi:hypothetical protein
MSKKESSADKYFSQVMGRIKGKRKAEKADEKFINENLMSGVAQDIRKLNLQGQELAKINEEDKKVRTLALKYMKEEGMAKPDAYSRARQELGIPKRERMSFGIPKIKKGSNEDKYLSYVMERIKGKRQAETAEQKNINGIPMKELPSAKKPITKKELLEKITSLKTEVEKPFVMKDIDMETVPKLIKEGQKKAITRSQLRQIEDLLKEIQSYKMPDVDILNNNKVPELLEQTEKLIKRRGRPPKTKQAEVMEEFKAVKKAEAKLKGKKESLLTERDELLKQLRAITGQPAPEPKKKRGRKPIVGKGEISFDPRDLDPLNIVAKTWEALAPKMYSLSDIRGMVADQISKGTFDPQKKMMGQGIDLSGILRTFAPIIAATAK